MIIVKVINQKVVQVAFAGAGQRQASGPLISSILATKNQKHLLLATRTLVQSPPQSQKVTNANNQQLIPIARNISFRQCTRANQGKVNNKTNAKVSFSISSASPSSASSFVHTPETLDPSIFREVEERESPFEVLKRKAKDAVEKRGESAAAAAKNTYYGQSFNETPSSSAVATTERRLVVLMSWLEAKEKHIEKYRQFYLERGFDVLNVKTSALDLLLPKVGAKKISKDFVRFMVEKEYSNVVLHGFSVGGYMFGQVLLDIDGQERQVRDNLLSSIRGIVFDSLVPLEGTCIGVANSITPNPVAAKVIEYLLRLYLFVGYNIATKYYVAASHKVWGGPLRCPTLFLNSKDDKISDHKIVWQLAKVWADLGVENEKVLLDSSPHVQIFTKHHQLYVERVESFLKRIKMY